MSYHDFEPESREGKIGKSIYMNALEDRPHVRKRDHQITEGVFDGPEKDQ